MKRSSLAIALGLFLLTTAAVSAQAFAIDEYRGHQPVIVVFARSRDDVRPFAFNLAVSSNWNRVSARNIAVVDVDPVSYDVDRVAEQLELGDLPFAVVLFARDGTRIMTAPSENSLDELLRALDLHSPGSDTEDPS